MYRLYTPQSLYTRDTGAQELHPQTQGWTVAEGLYSTGRDVGELVSGGHRQQGLSSGVTGALLSLHCLKVSALTITEVRDKIVTVGFFSLE